MSPRLRDLDCISEQASYSTSTVCDLPVIWICDSAACFIINSPHGLFVFTVDVGKYDTVAASTMIQYDQSFGGAYSIPVLLSSILFAHHIRAEQTWKLTRSKVQAQVLSSIWSLWKQIIVDASWVRDGCRERICEALLTLPFEIPASRH